MEFSSYPLNGEFLKEKKPSAKVNAEKKSADETDNLHALRGRIRRLSAVNEWVPCDPNCQTPAEEGNVSGGRGGFRVRDMNDDNHG